MARVKIDLKKMAQAISPNGSRAGAKPFGNNATLWVDRQLGLICLRTPYKKEFIEELKRLIPEADRDYSFEDKVWKFTTHYLEPVISMTGEHFKVEMLPDVTIDSSAVSEEIALLKHLDQQGLDRVWKAIAFCLHPDKGGDTGKFQEAKEAYEKLKGKR